jgi:hypothetical protein
MPVVGRRTKASRHHPIKQSGWHGCAAERMPQARSRKHVANLRTIAPTRDRPGAPGLPSVALSAAVWRRIAGGGVKFAVRQGIADVF